MISIQRPALQRRKFTSGYSSPIATYSDAKLQTFLKKTIFIVFSCRQNCVIYPPQRLGLQNPAFTTQTDSEHPRPTRCRPPEKKVGMNRKKPRDVLRKSSRCFSHIMRREGVVYSFCSILYCFSLPFCVIRRFAFALPCNGSE